MGGGGATLLQRRVDEAVDHADAVDGHAGDLRGDCMNERVGGGVGNPLLRVFQATVGTPGHQERRDRNHTGHDRTNWGQTCAAKGCLQLPSMAKSPMNTAPVASDGPRRIRPRRLLTGGLLVRIQPEEPNSRWSFRLPGLNCGSSRRSARSANPARGAKLHTSRGMSVRTSANGVRASGVGAHHGVPPHSRPGLVRSWTPHALRGDDKRDSPVRVACSRDPHFDVVAQGRQERHQAFRREPTGYAGRRSRARRARRTLAGS